MAEFKIDNYPEAIALYRLMLSYKYAPNLEHPEIFGSSLIARIASRLAETLNEMEKEQGYKNKSWNMSLEVGNAVWNLLIANTVATNRDWLTIDEDVKRKLAEAILTPFAYEPELVSLFIQSADEKARSQ